MKPLYLIDASIYIFRAYFGMPESITNSHGKPANAVYGYASFLADVLASKQPDAVAAMFDESLGSCFRNQIYPGYKASRAAPDTDLARQLNWCKELTGLMGIKTYASNKYEADDLIGTTARHLRPHGYRMVYVTADKDLGQLLRGRDRLWNYAKNEMLGGSEVHKRFGVAPGQIADYLGLAGDAVDDIPGVPGIGPKTASQLVTRFKSIERLLTYLDKKPLMESNDLEIRGLKRIDTLLRTHRQQALLSKQLATISESAAIRPTPATVSRKAPRRTAIARWLQENGFGQRLASRLGVIANTTV